MAIARPRAERQRVACTVQDMSTIARSSRALESGTQTRRGRGVTGKETRYSGLLFGSELSALRYRRPAKPSTSTQRTDPIRSTDQNHCSLESGTPRRSYECVLLSEC